MIEPIPHADEADIAEQARAVDDGIDECDDAVPDELARTRMLTPAICSTSSYRSSVKMTITHGLPTVRRRR